MFGSTENIVAATFIAKDQVTPVVNKMRASVAGVGGTGPGSLASSFVGMTAAMSASVGIGVVLGHTMESLGGFLGQATVAAINEQENIAKLGAALKANVKDFDGDTSAIERTIKERENLAFSDDALRESLATLVESTHDVKQALDGQSLAMDIARGRNISLNDASLLVAKTLQGNYVRSFKSAGLSLDGISDKTTALAFLQKTYAGQAEVYANTTKGQFEKTGIAINDVNEELGTHMIPTTNRLVQIVQHDVVPSFEHWVGVAGDLLDKLQGITHFANPKINEHLGHGSFSFTGGGGGGVRVRAAGGPVSAGQTYLVGERGPELLTMGQPGYVSPNGSSSHGHDIYMDGRLVGRAIDERMGRDLATSNSYNWTRS